MLADIPRRATRWSVVAVRRHWLFLALLAGAAVLRGVAWLAIHPAWWFIGDSIDYVADALQLHPGRWRPSGYSLLVLWPLLPIHRLALVTVAQHVMGLGVGTLVYATLLRLTLPRWGAALAAVPVLFDGYVVASEQMLVSEPLFGLLVAVALVVLLWRASPPGHLAVAAAGLLLGLAAITRTVGLPIVAVALLALVVRRVGWTRLIALGVTTLLPLAAYAVWFHSAYGRYGLTASNGIFLYGQATQFVDCGRTQLPNRLRPLCPTEPVGSRNEFFYIFDVDSPLVKAGLDELGTDDLAGQFATRAIRAQPLDYAALVWDRLVQSFQWDRGQNASDLDFRPTEVMTRDASVAGSHYQGRDPGPIYRQLLVTPLVTYQDVVWVRGPLALLALALAAAGLLFGRDPGRRGLQAAALLTAGSGLTLIFVPVLTTIVAGSIQRYRVPAIPALCLAGAIGLYLLANRWQEHRLLRQQPATVANEPVPERIEMGAR